MRQEQRARQERLQLIAAKKELVIDAMNEEEQIHQQQLSLEERQREAKAQEECRAAELTETQERALEKEIERLQVANTGEERLCRLQERRDALNV